MKISMKKLWGTACIVVAVLTGCASTPKTENVPASKVSKSVTQEIIDSKGMAAGVATPKWVEYAVESDYAKLGTDPEFEGEIIYIAENKGKNLDVLKSWVRNFEVNAKFSQQLGNHVLVRTGANLEGSLNKEESETFLKEIAASISNHSFSGLELKKDYWVKLRIHDNEKKSVVDEYQYFVVYAIDKNNLKDQIDVVLGKVDAKTETERRMKNETFSIMNEVYMLSSYE